MLNFSLEITNPELKKQFDDEQSQMEVINADILELQKKFNAHLDVKASILRQAVINGETKGILILPKDQEPKTNLIQLAK